MPPPAPWRDKRSDWGCLSVRAVVADPSRRAMHRSSPEGQRDMTLHTPYAADSALGASAWWRIRSPVRLPAGLLLAHFPCAAGDAGAFLGSQSLAPCKVAPAQHLTLHRRNCTRDGLGTAYDGHRVSQIHITRGPVAATATTSLLLPSLHTRSFAPPPLVGFISFKKQEKDAEFQGGIGICCAGEWCALV